MTAEDFTARLLDTFRAELDEQLQAMNDDLLALEAAPGDAERLKRLFRSAHTLKGAAHAVGVPEVEQICHSMEARFATARDTGDPMRESDFASLFADLDRLSTAASSLGTAGAPRETSTNSAASAGNAPAAQPAAAIHDSPTPTRSGRSRAAASAPAAAESGSTRVRVDEAKLDAVLSTAADLLVSAGNVESILAGMAGESRVARAEARRLRQLSAAVREDMRRMRMRPFGEACETLPRLVRDLAQSSGKEVSLHIAGADLEADRVVLDGVREALLHLVRNAIDHGIEMPQERLRAGKAREGRVDVQAAIRGDRLLVTVSDDGEGLDTDLLRAQLVRYGINEPEDAREWGRLLFEGGLSSRTEATTISGRGVGLDAVRAAIEGVRGEVDLSWEPGGGTTFRLDCPLTLAMQRVVIVSVSGHLVAFPSVDVQRAERIAHTDIRRIEGRDVLPDPAGPVPLVALASLLGPGYAPSSRTETFLVVRLRTAHGRLGVVVDELVSEEEVLIRSLERGHRPGTQIAGVALLGHDRVALVLRTAAIVDAGLGADSTGLGQAAAAVDAAPPHILVADDSITTRTLEKNVLETAGYQVTTAHDGAEAWRLLQERQFDLVLSDVEMPRMDGFELCRAIRASQRIGELPVVLLTALASPEQRARGLEMGADAYLVKSSFDQNELLEIMRQLIGVSV